MPLSPDELWKRYQRSLKNNDDLDARIIGPMAIPIEPYENGEIKGWWYTCRHWDKDTGLCQIYENRPRMCRDYPYAREEGCEYCGWRNEEYINQEVLPAGGVSLPDKLRGTG